MASLQSILKAAKAIEEVAAEVAGEFQSDVGQIQDIPRVQFQAPYSNANIIENMMDVISRGAATGAVAATTGAQAITDLVTIASDLFGIVTNICSAIVNT